MRQTPVFPHLVWDGVINTNREDRSEDITPDSRDYDAISAELIATQEEVHGLIVAGGLHWTGPWSPFTAYLTHDAVSYLGNSYIAVSNNTGSTPPSADWDLLAQRGAQGAAGAQGDTGPQGTDGAPGGQGPQGDLGTQGDTGPQGTQGVAGPQGTQGDLGVQGVQGDVGNNGPQGTQGPQGDTGSQGLQGDAGTQGAQGAEGTQGVTGVSGYLEVLENDSGVPTPRCTAVYIKNNGKTNLALATNAARAEVIGLVADASIGYGSPGNIQIMGSLVATTAEWDAITGDTGGLTSGSIYYADITVAGNITKVVPTGVGKFETRIGKALSPTKLLIGIEAPIAL
jgi:hypothetical protein